MSSDWLVFENAHTWHPYTSIPAQPAPLAVDRAEGVDLILNDGQRLIDGMSSWWSTIHGYNHPQLNEALFAQAKRMSHVMFGGLTHKPAATLVEQLVAITPEPLNRVFLCDSGSIAVEVALKMAFQYWYAKDSNKSRFMTLRRGYHGDTIGAMSVSDPDNGLHHMFSGLLAKQIFLPAPPQHNDEFDSAQLDETRQLFERHHAECAALILEPIVQGAGGMRMYSAEYLRALKALCVEFDVLLIADEIATGFARTGELFACNHADVNPDIMCLGKALTGGMMTMAATLCTSDVADVINHSSPGVFMHGPTFMANPLSSAVASASISLLLSSDWQQIISSIEQQLKDELSDLGSSDNVNDVRVMGAIGVVEMKQSVDMAQAISVLRECGVWLRPFGKLIYTMPPYIINTQELSKVTHAMRCLAAL